MDVTEGFQASSRVRPAQPLLPPSQGLPRDLPLTTLTVPSLAGATFSNTQSQELEPYLHKDVCLTMSFEVLFTNLNTKHNPQVRL